MSMTDPLGDMLTRIRNGQRVRKNSISSPASKLRANVLDVLEREGFIRGYSQQEVRPGIAEIQIELKYHEGDPVIREISRISTPGSGTPTSPGRRSPCSGFASAMPISVIP